MKLSFPFIAVILILCSLSCEKIKYYRHKPITDVQTKILAHQGGGFSDYQVNTLAASKFGFEKTDGIEVDVQLSNDRTIWLSHSVALPYCDGSKQDCFTSATDIQIIELDSCLGNDFCFSTLDSVLAFMKKNYPEKFISIDVKAWEPCDVFTSDILGLMNVIGEEIIKLVTRHSLQNRVMVESETASFLNFVKRHSSGIGLYLTTLGDFERGIGLALESGFDGISFKYKFDEEISAEHINMIHKKGLRIHLWTVNNEEDIAEALSINPDFIQTDNIEFFSGR